VPIDTIEFPSNWDLSAARAASVVRELIDSGIDPARLVAVGYGEYHPIADNKSGEGRFKNRRVSLVLISRSLARYGVKENERLKLLKD
jgi:chemotaxis protein MotB